VTGTDFGGNSMDQACHVDAEGTGVSLVHGSCFASVASSLISSDGTIYSVPSQPIAFEIGEDVGDSASPRQSRSMTLMAAARITTITTTHARIATTCCLAGSSSMGGVNYMPGGYTNVQVADIKSMLSDTNREYVRSTLVVK
jgi:hypothetical protein